VVNDNEIQTALRYNHYWPLAKYDSEIIGSIKLGFDKVYITDYAKNIEFPDKTAFIYDTYVLKKYRNNGVATQLILDAAEYSKNKGYQKLGCHIPKWNKASIIAYEKIGFKKISYIRYYKIFGICFIISKSLRKSKKQKDKRIKKIGIPYEQN
jgi:ribosomal protein S18 acetylase RimI-like enzyme